MAIKNILRGAEYLSHNIDHAPMRRPLRVPLRALTVFPIALTVALFWVCNKFVKEPCRTSTLSGEQWVMELLKGNRRRFRENVRMEPETFVILRDLLLQTGGIWPSRWVGVDEKLALFLYTVGHGATNREAQKRFQRSGCTISLYV